MAHDLVGEPLGEFSSQPMPAIYVVGRLCVRPVDVCQKKMAQTTLIFCASSRPLAAFRGSRCSRTRTLNLYKSSRKELVAEGDCTVVAVQLESETTIYARSWPVMSGERWRRRWLLRPRLGLCRFAAMGVLRA